MKALTISCLIPALTAGLVFALPTTALAKDKHHHHDSNHCYSGSRTVVIGSPYYSRGYYSPYSSGYSRYPGSYYSSGYSSGYCAPRPSIGFSLFSAPSYTYRSSRSYPASRASSSSDDLALEVQRALRRSGYYYGDIDGDIGPESRGAIREYQRDRGLPATGRIDSSLLRSLRIG